MPPKKITPESAYLKALDDARRRAFTIRQASHTRLLRAFSQALTDIAALEKAGGPINAARAASMKEQCTNILQKLRADVTNGIDSAVQLTVKDLVSIHEKVNRSILTQHAPGLATRMAFDHIPVKVLAVITARNGNAAHFRSLLKYRFQTSVEQVDNIINSAVLRGVSAGQLTRDLATVMADPTIAGHLPSGSRLHRGELGNIDWSRYGIDPANVRQVRTLLYDARRIAVTENANAMREANAHSLTASPVAALAKWQTNSRHALLDACDVLATSVIYEGVPAGFYPVEKWPRGPHPHCGCYQGAIQMRPVRDWAKARKSPPKLRSEPYLHHDIRDKVTPKMAQRAMEAANVQTIKVDPAIKGLSKPKPKAPPKPVQKGPPRMTKTDAQIDADIRAILRKPSSQVRTAEDFADQMAEAMDAKALGFDVQQQVPTRALSKDANGRLIKFDDTSAEAHNALATANWDGTISLSRDTSVDLSMFRSEYYLSGGDQRGGKDGISAVKTLIHEFEHMRSPKRFTGAWADASSYGLGEEGRYIEEGIVEHKARNRMARIFFDENHWRYVKDWSMRRSYIDYTEGMSWFEETFGDAALEHVWQGTNTTERVARIGEKLRPFLELKVNLITDPDLRKKARSALFSAPDRNLVVNLHKFADVMNGYNQERAWGLVISKIPPIS